MNLEVHELVWSKWSSFSRSPTPRKPRATYVIHADPRRYLRGREGGRGFNFRG